MMNIRHSSRTDEWYTPPWLTKQIVHFFRDVDFDPASSTNGNRYLKAKSILTKKDDALQVDWPACGTLFLNPPGGKVGNKSKAALFWQKLMRAKEDCKFAHAIFLAFSLEQLQTTQGKDCKSIGEFTFCVPRKRIRFYDCYWNAGPAPSHSNMIVYVPGTVDETGRFINMFETIGDICNGT